MPALSDPLQVGNCKLGHRIIMAPMTRLRADDEHVPSHLMLDYYSQRASVPGTLLITEATFISPDSRGRDANAPGIFTRQQMQSWGRIATEVHRKECFIFMQLWHVGRAARAHELARTGLEMVSSSNIPISSDHRTPRPMTTAEIQSCISSFAQAAQNAIVAGFDGVEIHAANGYLIDQFTQDTCNVRTDEWGGSIENRSRFCLEVVKAVCESIGAARTALRLSPWNEFQVTMMKDPIPQFTHLVTEARKWRLAYLHLVEPRVSGNQDKPSFEKQSLDFALRAWNGSGPVILAGGFTPEAAQQTLEDKFIEQEVGFAFGRHFISNPDLPNRIFKGMRLSSYHRETFYKVKSSDGYTDYPFVGDR